MKLIALIDGGGTKTQVRFLNQAIRQSYRGCDRPLKLGLGLMFVKQIMQAIALAGVPMPVRYVAGLAGERVHRTAISILSNAPCERYWFQIATLGCLVRIVESPGGCLPSGRVLHLRGWTNPGSSYDEAALVCGRGGGAWIRLRFLQNWFALLIEGLIDQSHQVLIDRLGISQSVIRWMEFANAAQPRQLPHWQSDRGS